MEVSWFLAGLHNFKWLVKFRRVCVCNGVEYKNCVHSASKGRPFWLVLASPKVCLRIKTRGITVAVGIGLRLRVHSSLYTSAKPCNDTLSITVAAATMTNLIPQIQLRAGD